ncbi:hypothetical protein A6R70_00830 [Agrobacterium rubi]|nr:hypothetical protein [Agrobacterium rubi]
MTNDQKSLSDIKMKPYIVFMLYQHGYETLADLAHLSNADILRMPRMVVAIGAWAYHDRRR